MINYLNNYNEICIRDGKFLTLFETLLISIYCLYKKEHQRRSEDESIAHTHILKFFSVDKTAAIEKSNPHIKHVLNKSQCLFTQVNVKETISDNV